MKITFTLNGTEQSHEVYPGTTLLEVLRREGHLEVKHGCDSGDCGVCTVLIDGKPINSCILLAAQADGANITTVKDLGDLDNLHTIQEAFLDTGAVQCGFCTPAMLLVAKELLERTADPTEDEIRDALAGVLCRCTAYVKPMAAIAEAAARLKKGGAQ